jgi:ankyrin repeat protein
LDLSLNGLLLGKLIDLAKHGNVALGVASEFGQVEVMKALLAAGADPTERDNKAIKVLTI